MLVTENVFVLRICVYAFNIEYDGDFNTDFDLNYKNAETEARFKFNYNLDKTKLFIHKL